MKSPAFNMKTVFGVRPTSANNGESVRDTFPSALQCRSISTAVNSSSEIDSGR